MAPKKATPAEEAKKRKLEEKAEEGAAKKEAKKEDASKVKKEDEDLGGEREKNALADKRASLEETVGFNPVDTTLNVVPSAGGKLLMALTEGGMQYLVAGARANVGMSAGRYMYEVKIVEALNPAESSGPQRARVPMPRQLVRLGFSVAGSTLVLGDSDGAAFFDSEGFYVSGKGKKTVVAQRFTRDQVIAVLLNLDPKSPNANTISLFRDGERISEPQPLPEQLLGKPLYPHVAFRSVTVQMLFGPEPAHALPFTCRMLQGAAKADVTVSPVPSPPFDVVLPVALPDEGTFEWLDTFLEKHPHFVELSERKIQEWATSSGLAKPKITGPQTSNDKPLYNFGLPSMDDGSIRRVINAIATVVPRHYVLMEVKSNLVAADRQETLKRFGLPHYRKIAHVVMGEPGEEFKKLQLDKRLKEKQEKAELEWKQKKAVEERKKLADQRQKQIEAARKKAMEEMLKKKQEAEKKAAGEAGEGAAGNAAGGEEAAASTAEEQKEAKEEASEVKAEEGGTAEEVKDEKEDEKMEESPPQVELTEEEQKQWFTPIPPGASGDLTPAVMSQTFSSFGMPDESEGFDEVRFEWQGKEESQAHLLKWIQERKLTSRIEDLQPGQWFQQKNTEWQKSYQEWQKKYKEYSVSPQKKAKEEAKRKKAEEKAKAEAEGAEEGKDVEMDEAVDLVTVTDVCDVGDGEPLFANFTFEDWALLQLRVELYFLMVAFKTDVDDPERIGIHDQHLSFYYSKYFRKQLNPKFYGVNTNDELCRLVKDTVLIDPSTHVLTSQLAEETENVEVLLKLTEECRRERQRRIEAGDETAKLRFSAMAMNQGVKTVVAGAVPGGGVARPMGTFPAGAVAAAGRPAGMTWAGGFRPTAPAGRWPVPQQPTYAARAPAWRK